MCPFDFITNRYISYIINLTYTHIFWRWTNVPSSSSPSSSSSCHNLHITQAKYISVSLYLFFWLLVWVCASMCVFNVLVHCDWYNDGWLLSMHHGINLFWSICDSFFIRTKRQWKLSLSININFYFCFVSFLANMKCENVTQTQNTNAHTFHVLMMKERNREIGSNKNCKQRKNERL